MKRKNLIIWIILVLGFIFIGAVLINISNLKNENNKVNDVINDENNDLMNGVEDELRNNLNKDIDNNQELTENNEQVILLEKINEKYSFDNLTLKFNGNNSNFSDGNDEMYEYVLEIFIDNDQIDSSIFGNMNKKYIWSDNHAAEFRLIDIDNYYILISYIAKQNDGCYVLIIDKNGNFINKFEDVSIDIDRDNLEIKITDCLTNNLDEVCSENKYNLSQLNTN